MAHVKRFLKTKRKPQNAQLFYVCCDLVEYGISDCPLVLSIVAGISLLSPNFASGYVLAGLQLLLTSVVLSLFVMGEGANVVQAVDKSTGVYALAACGLVSSFWWSTHGCLLHLPS